MLRIVACMIAILTSAPTWVAARETGFLDRTVTVGSAEYRYQVYVPRAFDPTRRWPVILALHGGGEYGGDGLRQTAGALARAIRLHPERYPAIVVFPQAHADGTPGWQLQGGEAYRNPQRFAAVVVICGFMREFTGRTSGVAYPPIAPTEAGDPYLAIARRVSSLPIWLFHGDADQSVSVDESRRMAAALKSVGAEVHYTELPGVGHAAWDPAYDDAAMASWLFARRRH
jgi:predicted peptidase